MSMRVLTPELDKYKHHEVHGHISLNKIHSEPGQNDLFITLATAHWMVAVLTSLDHRLDYMFPFLIFILAMLDTG